MEEKIVLRLRYIHNEYADIVVDDHDKCSILDILVDMIEESQKIGMILPEHPALWYAHNSQNFQLESDNDVMKMFTIFHGAKIIKLDIGSAESLGVNMENRTCGCGEWQIRGIPCRHAVRVIIEMRGHPEHYVSPWYSTEMYKKTYSMNYRPVPDEEQWPRFDLPKIDPPSFKRGVGRPPMKRRRTEEEGASRKLSRVVRCGRCKAFGHNVKTCKGGATARELKEQGIRVQRNQKKKGIQAQPVENVMYSAPTIPGSQ